MQCINFVSIILCQRVYNFYKSIASCFAISHLLMTFLALDVISHHVSLHAISIYHDINWQYHLSLLQIMLDHFADFHVTLQDFIPTIAIFISLYIFTTCIIFVLSAKKRYVILILFRM